MSNNCSKVKHLDIGDCGAPSNGYGMQCNGIGGQPPATLAEFTLSGGSGSDYYDLSNVDGNTLSMTIRPIPGQYTSVNNPSLGKYNCGTVSYLEYLKTRIFSFENIEIIRDFVLKVLSQSFGLSFYLILSVLMTEKRSKHELVADVLRELIRTSLSIVQKMKFLRIKVIRSKI
jgi:hypothetical protein